MLIRSLVKKFHRRKIIDNTKKLSYGYKYYIPTCKDFVFVVVSELVLEGKFRVLQHGMQIF